MTRPRRDDGFTLVEVLLVMTIGLVILGATLMSFTQFSRRDKQSQTLNDATQMARNSMDIASRQLRNLANQDPSQLTTTIAVAQPDDLVFQTSDPSRKWVRYCLATSGGTPASSTTRARLWESESLTAAAPGGSMLGACPGTGWTTQRTVADYVTNKHAGRDFPVFSYSCSTAAGPGCPAGSVDFPRITNIKAQLYIDPNPGRAPAELRTASGIFLRNQNERPAASFTSVPTGTTRGLLFNASASTDPEGRTLQYDWFRGTGAISLTPEEACASEIKHKANGTTLIYLGQGVTYRYDVPTGIASPMPIQLVVRDPGCLYGTQTKSVVIP